MKYKIDIFKIVALVKEQEFSKQSIKVKRIILAEKCTFEMNQYKD